jgi:hypothetical protein
MHALLDDLFASHGICFDGEPTPDGVRAIDGAKASNEPRADSQSQFGVLNARCGSAHSASFHLPGKWGNIAVAGSFQ